MQNQALSTLSDGGHGSVQLREVDVAAVVRADEADAHRVEPKFGDLLDLFECRLRWKGVGAPRVPAPAQELLRLLRSRGPGDSVASQQEQHDDKCFHRKLALPSLLQPIRPVNTHVSFAALPFKPMPFSDDPRDFRSQRHFLRCSLVIVPNALASSAYF